MAESIHRKSVFLQRPRTYSPRRFSLTAFTHISRTKRPCSFIPVKKYCNNYRPMKTFASYSWARLQDQNRDDCNSVLRSSRQESDSLSQMTNRDIVNPVDDSIDVRDLTRS